MSKMHAATKTRIANSLSRLRRVCKSSEMLNIDRNPLNRASALGFASLGRYTEHIRSASLGLNWVLNEHVIVRHAYVHGFYSDDVLLGGRAVDNEGALMVEWQLHF